MATQDRPGPRGILEHRQFREALETARFDAFRRDRTVRVRDADEFEVMRRYVQGLHGEVEVTHSFADAAGQVFDCIPIAQQPSLRGAAGPIASPPDLGEIMAQGGAAARPALAEAQPAAQHEAFDRHGNPTRCPEGCVPVRRITLSEVARFETLASYRSKTPRSRRSADPSAPVADLSQNHRYAYTEQDTANLGGHNFLSVWAPPVGDKQIFSLAQHWYAGGDGAAHQTLEVGWQVFPQKYGHGQPVLFIFWTNDNYNQSQNYNLEHPGFVQTNNAWSIGGALSPVSGPAGQYELEVAVYFYQANWWLYLGGTQAANAVGYFPASIYNGGAMATQASVLQYGGETVADVGGTWPAMGSGAFAADGWQHAAYQRDIFMFPTGGGASYAALTPFSPSPGCYSASLGAAKPPWNVYFFFGGPGGGDC